MRHISGCLALALALPLGVLHTQDTKALPRGTRVRVWGIPSPCEFTGPSCPYQWVVGTVASIDSLSIVLRDKRGEQVFVPRAPNTQLEVSTRRGRCWGESCVGVGFFSGAAAGALLGASHSCTSECGLLYLLTVPAGALVGTIIGATAGGEHWEHVEAPIRVGLRPDGYGHVALRVSMSF